MMRFHALICRGARLLALCVLTFGLAAYAAAAPPAPGPGPGPDGHPGPGLGPGGHPGPGLGPGGHPGPGPAPGGGYTGPGPALVSLKEALALPHDTPVAVKGNITQYLGRDDYTFTDSTGTAEVKIPPHAWQGQNVSEADTVELQGEVKQERTRTVLHVRRLIKR